jgi:pilus assembly protein CpaB
MLSLIFASLSVITAFVYFYGMETKYKSLADPVIVVIAKERIPQGSSIKANQIEEISVPKEYAQPKAFSSVSQVFNANSKTVYVSLTAIERGEQVLATKVSKPSDITGLANIIPDGYRALPVEFDDNNHTSLTPGSHIDIMSILQYTDKNKQEQEVVYVAAQNVLVLSVGNDFLGVARKNSDDNASSKSNITLAVTLEQAETIMLAKQNGALKYVIRPAGDNDAVNIKNMKMSDIIKDASSIQSLGEGQDPLDKSKKEILALINKYNK